MPFETDSHETAWLFRQADSHEIDAPNVSTQFSAEASRGTVQFHTRTHEVTGIGEGEARQKGARTCSREPALHDVTRTDADRQGSPRTGSREPELHVNIPRARDSIRRMLTTWASRAESELFDIYQVKDEDLPKFQRHSADTTPPSERWVFPAWSKSSPHPRSCPDGRAWRTLGRKIQNLSLATGRASHDILVSIRRWRPPMAFIKADPPLENPKLIVDAVRAQRNFWRNFKVADLPLVQFETLSDTAAALASQFEKRHRLLSSKGWQRWCRTCGQQCPHQVGKATRN